ENVSRGRVTALRSSGVLCDVCKSLPRTPLTLDPPICLMSGSSLGFEYERGEWAGGSVPVSHRSLPQMFPKVSSRPCGFVLEQERIGQDNTVLGGLSTACQSREKSLAHGQALGRCRISFLAR